MPPKTIPQIALLPLVQLLSWCMSSAQQCKPINTHYKDGYALLNSTYETTTAEHFEACYIHCLHDSERCKSINYYANGTCELNNVTNAGNFSSRFVPEHKSTYADVRDPDVRYPPDVRDPDRSVLDPDIRDPDRDGSSSHLAALSCKTIIDLIGPRAESGIYWIRLRNGSTQTAAFQVYCDMTTDGGGWTLVYSYRFTNFASFNALGNAVTPIPTWPVDLSKGMWVPTSTTVPMNKTAYSAMNFTWWKEIGSEFLVKSNITHWISCKTGTGDLVNWKEGTVNCKNVKSVATTCLGYVPTSLKIHNCGPALMRNSYYYLNFDGRTNNCWPVHDPCGTASANNHLTNVSFPGGALYIR